MLEQVSTFLKYNPLNSESLQLTQQAIPEIKEEHIKNDLNILVYR